MTVTTKRVAAILANEKAVKVKLNLVLNKA